MSHEVDVIGLGENSVDRVLTVPLLPGAAGASSKMPLVSTRTGCGGQVATAMVTCASLGLRAAYVGAVGDDEDGRLVRSTLAAHHLNLTHLLTIPGAATRSATILVDADGDRSVLWQRDEKLNLRADFLDAIDLAGVRLVHVDDTDIDAAVRLAERARQAGIFVTTDIDASARVRGCAGAQVRHLMRLATHPILSEEALAALSGEIDPERGLRALRSECDGLLCVTLGARGAMALDGQTLVFAPGVAVTPVDTTGAGDAFRAGFIYAVLEGRPLEAAMHFANQVASQSCLRAGAIQLSDGMTE